MGLLDALQTPQGQGLLNAIQDGIQGIAAGYTPGGNVQESMMRSQQMRMQQQQFQQDQQLRSMQIQRMQAEMPLLKSAISDMTGDNAPAPSAAPSLSPVPSSSLPMPSTLPTVTGISATSSMPGSQPGGPNVGSASTGSLPAQVGMVAPSGTAPMQGAGAYDPTTDPVLRHLQAKDFANSLLGFKTDLADKYAAARFGQVMPPPLDIEKALMSQGIQPGSKQWNDALAGFVQHQNLIPMRQGNALYDPTTGNVSAYNPQVPEGSAPVFVGGLPIRVGMIPGANGAITASAGAQTLGKTNNTLFTVNNSDGTTTLQPGSTITGNAPASWTGQPLSPQDLSALRAKASQGDPDATQALAAYNRAQFNRSASPGQVSLDKATSAAISQRYAQTVNEAAGAPTVISQLRNIQQLAPNAITGQESDRLAYLNGLLSMVGSQNATDLKTATDLLDKNANQIVTTLGQNGLGTDAARTLVEAANPNMHMTPQAINEAVQQLVGVQQMNLAKAKFLTPVANNQQAYLQREQQFNGSADPRVWQFMALSPAEQAQFKARLANNPQDMARFRQSLGALDQMGALQ